MPEIIKLYQETLPAVTLVGRVYHDCDRDEHETFGACWGEWFGAGRFEQLEALGKPLDGSYVGAMRMNGDVFEYWIGMLMEDIGEIPDGFTALPLDSGEFAVAWIQGREDAGLYAMHDSCMAAFSQQGWKTKSVGDGCWYIERYTCPRFTVPNEKGEVILDYLVSMN